MRRFRIRKDEGCISCLRCARECSFGAIEAGEDRTLVFHHEKCTDCQRCVSCCPAGAIFITEDGNRFRHGSVFTDDDIRNTISEVYLRTGYVADPHGACACRGLMDGLRPGQTGVFLETAHPAKFKDTVGEILGTEIQIPERLMAFLDARKQSVKTGGKYDEFKEYLLSRC